jgi:O-antigen ligase
MFNQAAEKVSIRVVVLGAPLTTLFLTTKVVTDPVNATKLVIAGAFCFSLAFLLFAFQSKYLLNNFKLYLLASLLFLMAALNSTIFSDSPLSQNLYGSFGRNTGLIAYTAFTLGSLGMLGIRSIDNFKKLILSLQLAGLINVLYCLWVIIFGDFISWNNPYGNILGTLGNPNFISAFLGIFITTLIAFMADANAKLRYRAAALLVSLVAFYEIVDSNAIQGIVVTLGGAAIVGFFVIRSRFKSYIFQFAYLLMALALGIVSLLGALQKGPLSFIYKKSVSLRGAYWQAGYEMGLQKPVTGVGMDSYGDWYRRARSEQAATVLPGPNTITNASHNVVLDFFAYGGWPLLLSYLVILIITALSSIKVISRSPKYNPVFVALFAAWICYLTQSLISINQIGLAIWGWLLTGALVAYERSTRDSKELNEGSAKQKSVRPKAAGVISPQLVAGIGILVGSLLAIPPLNADMRWRAALDSKDSNKVMAALETGYLSPSDSQRYSQAVRLFASSNLLDDAHALALRATEFNPDYFDSWKLLYFLSNSTKQEKAVALRNMKRLDPRNPDVLSK